MIAETVAPATPVTPRYRAREAGKLRFMRSNRQLAGVDLKALPRAEPAYATLAKFAAEANTKNPNTIIAAVQRGHQAFDHSG